MPCVCTPPIISSRNAPYTRPPQPECISDARPKRNPHFEIDLNSQHKQDTRDERPAAQRCRRRGFIAPPYQPPRAARGGLAQPRSPPQPGRAIFVLSLAAAGEVALSIRTGWPKRPIERGGVPPRHQGRSSGCRSPPTPPAGAPDCRVAGLLPRRRI